MKQIIVIKIGGNALTELTESFYQNLKTLRAQGKKIILVHGGGNEISRYAEKLQLPVVKKGGIRVTDAETLNVTKMALLGLVQPQILQQLSLYGLPALGLNAACNQLITGDYLNESIYGAVGHIQALNSDFLNAVLADYIAVIAPLALTANGAWLNVNGDTAAADIAALMNADALYLLTDVTGVLNQGQLIAELNEAQAQQLLDANIITQGMQPKIAAAFSAKKQGVAQVFIGQSVAAGTEII